MDNQQVSVGSNQMDVLHVWDKFSIGFWHPFGPYSGRSVHEILKWKSDEARRYGWTLWSFVHSPTAHVWQRLLQKADGYVFVLCADSQGADPDLHEGKLFATHYRHLIGDDQWRDMPDRKLMNVTNPFKRRGRALAFTVANVIEVDPVVPPFALEWYCKGQERWLSDKLPTRGEYLIQRGGILPPRRVRALLELVPPYLAEIKHEL